MDALTLIIGALTAGLIASAKPVTEQAIKDAYNGLKTIVVDRYRANVEALEKRPDSEIQQAALKELLQETKAEEDIELIEKSKHLLVLVYESSPEILVAQAIDFEEVEAAYIKVRKILVEGNAKGIRMNRVNVQEGIEIEDVTVRNSPN